MEVRMQTEQQCRVTSLLLPHLLSPWKSSIRAPSPPLHPVMQAQSARLEVPEQAQLLSPHEFPQSLPQLHPSPISVFGVHSECCSLKPDTGLLPQSLCCPPCPDSCPQGYSHAVCTSKHLMVRSASGVGRAPHTFTFQCICRWSSSCKAVLRVPSVNGLYSVHSLIYWAYAFPFASNSA